MDFALRFQGLLPTSNARNHVAAENTIRSQLHFQLEELCAGEETFEGALADPLPEGRLTQSRVLVRQPEQPWGVFLTHEVMGIRFVPLISRVHFLTCEVDIKFWRMGSPGKIILNSGDIDGRLKVLLDALRMPFSDQEVEPKLLPPGRCYCLLEDDELITKLSVSTHKLLGPLKGNGEQYVDLAMYITVNSTRTISENLGI